MRFGMQPLKSWIKGSVYLGSIILFASIGSGCASTQKTTTETTVTYPNKVVVNEVVDHEGEQTTTTTTVVAAGDEQRETTTTATETKAANPGIISSTFHAIGYVIVLPFIIIGGVFRMIFGG